MAETKNQSLPQQGPHWAVMDIASLAVIVAGIVYTLLPWGVFQTRLHNVDIMLMVTPAFIFVSALIAFAGTVLRRKTESPASPFGLALAVRILIWGSIIGLIGPIAFRFITLLIAG